MIVNGYPAWGCRNLGCRQTTGTQSAAIRHPLPGGANREQARSPAKPGELAGVIQHIRMAESGSRGRSMTRLLASGRKSSLLPGSQEQWQNVQPGTRLRILTGASVDARDGRTRTGATLNGHDPIGSAGLGEDPLGDAPLTVQNRVKEAPPGRLFPGGRSRLISRRDVSTLQLGSRDRSRAVQWR